MRIFLEEHYKFGVQKLLTGAHFSFDVHYDVHLH